VSRRPRSPPRCDHYSVTVTSVIGTTHNIWPRLAPRWPGPDQATSGSHPPGSVTTPGGAPPGRPTILCRRSCPPLTAFAPRRHRGFWAGLALSGRGRTGPGKSAGAYHVFKSGREPQPSGKRVNGLAVQQPSARRVGALLELEDDTQGLGLIHTGQHRSQDRGSRHGSTVVFAARRAGRAPAQTAPSLTAERNAAGNSPRELMESFW